MRGSLPRCQTGARTTHSSAHPGRTMTTEEPMLSTPWRSDPSAMADRIAAWWNANRSVRRHRHRRDRARGQRHVERDAAVHHRARRRRHTVAGALRRPSRAAGVAAVPGVPRVRPRAAATRDADRGRAHRGARSRRCSPTRPTPSWLGSPFLLMRRVDGIVPSDIPPYTMAGWLFEASEAEQRKLERESVRVLARSARAARPRRTTSRSSTGRSSPPARSTSTSTTSVGTTTGRATARRCR